jgi:hypothetical protein
MNAAVPPRPSLRVPRPGPRSAAPATPKSEPRHSLHSVDLEDGTQEQSERQQRATLVHPLGEIDPLDVVMDMLRGIRCKRAVEAASVCLAACAKAVGCRAAIVHLWDKETKDFVIVYALGKSAGMLLNSRHIAEDPLLDEAFDKRVPRVVNYEGARAPLPRHAVVGGAWSVLVAPVTTETGMALGAIELVDPLDGSCFDDRHIAATRYTTQRLAELLKDVESRIGKLIAPPAD